MQKTNYCAEDSRQYDNLVTLRDEIRQILDNKETRVSVSDKKEKITAVLEYFESFFPPATPIMPFIYKNFQNTNRRGAPRFSRFRSEVELLRESLDVNWLYLDFTAYKWLGLFESGGRFYLISDFIDEDSFDDNNNLVSTANWHNESLWLWHLGALVFKSKESAVKYIVHNQKILQPFEKEDVLKKLGEQS
jgi:hypothetical protein